MNQTVLSILKEENNPIDGVVNFLREVKNLGGLEMLTYISSDLKNPSSLYPKNSVKDTQMSLLTKFDLRLAHCQVCTATDKFESSGILKRKKDGKFVISSMTCRMEELIGHIDKLIYFFGVLPFSMTRTIIADILECLRPFDKMSKELLIKLLELQENAEYPSQRDIYMKHLPWFEQSQTNLFVKRFVNMGIVKKEKHGRSKLLIVDKQEIQRIIDLCENFPYKLYL